MARQEIFSGLKNINQVSLILLPIFFSSIGLLFGSLPGVTISPQNFLLILKLISQTIFLLWMLGLSVLCNVACLTGYVQALEEKINYFFADKITCWESVVAEKYQLKLYSGQFIGNFLWNSFYLFGFILLGLQIKDRDYNNRFFTLTCIETGIILILFCLVVVSRKKGYHLMKTKNVT